MKVSHGIDDSAEMLSNDGQEAFACLLNILVKTYTASEALEMGGKKLVSSQIQQKGGAFKKGSNVN